MRPLHTYFFLLTFICQPLSYAVESQWKPENKTHHRGDIAIYTRHAKDEPVKAFRGVMQVAQSPLDVLAVLMDLPSYPEWVYQCNSTRANLVSEDPKLIYMSFNGIWPTAGRDILVDFNITQKEENGPIHIHVFDAEHAYPKQGKYVRIPQLDNHWHIRPLSDGWTEIEFQTQFRAGGRIPNWLMNMVITMAPRKTMQGMKKLLASGKYETKSVDELPIKGEEIMSLTFRNTRSLALVD